MTDTITTPAEALEAAAQDIAPLWVIDFEGWLIKVPRRGEVQAAIRALASRIAAPVATVKPQEGPDRIWAEALDAADGWFVEIVPQHAHNETDIEYIRADLAQPAAQVKAEAVAGAYLAAAGIGDIFHETNAFERGFDPTKSLSSGKVIANLIRGMIPADATAALARRDAEVRKAALREAADKVLDRQGRKALGTTEGNAAYDSAMSDAYHTILALIDKEPAHG